MNTTPSLESNTRFLVEPHTVVETSGSGPVLDLGPWAGRPVMVVLRVTEMIEQESLHVSVWGSADGQNWGSKPLFWFPQVFYQELKPAALDLSQRPEVHFLRAQWEVNRWGRGMPRPHFEISLEIQPLMPAA